ncbi:uncharacterized protein LOC141902810 [Tubulanus polymorphus]|uniref:uncharacterized protein LOC141902810 n=1 Tax=Tubulanus polymorphus TaxID=672921 RepID=UPI003DA48392
MSTDHKETAADKDPQFVKVQTLTKGVIFGLECMLFDKQPSLSLVSNGCECILIDKKFYQNHCQQQSFYDLRRKVSPYPSEDQLQNDLSVQTKWNRYKRETVESLIRACTNTS